MEPAPWLPGAHAQTIGGHLLRPRRFTYARERLNTPDGDFLDVDFSEPLLGGPEAGLPVVVLLHGLEGCSQSGYMVQAARQCRQAGFRAVALNFRGRSGTPNRAPRAYHAGETDDLAFLIDTLQSRIPGAPLAAVGFSLGGNVLLKYLGESGRQSERNGPPPSGAGTRTPLKAAVAISVPLDLAASTERMERGMGRLYTRFFLRSLRTGVRAKRANGPLTYDVEAALRASTLRAFDEAVTAPLHGFRSAEHYYARSSAIHHLDSIRVPTLILQARDDPFHRLPADHESAVAANPFLHAGIVDRGGHVGFIEGPIWAPRFWAEAEAVRFLSTCLAAAGSPAWRPHDHNPEILR
jgi:predicted alpha/beta-fold hydrolase